MFSFATNGNFITEIFFGNRVSVIMRDIQSTWQFIISSAL